MIQALTGLSGLSGQVDETSPNPPSYTPSLDFSDPRNSMYWVTFV
jgi:hypothetical protein